MRMQQYLMIPPYYQQKKSSKPAQPTSIYMWPSLPVSEGLRLVYRIFWPNTRSGFTLNLTLPDLSGYLLVKMFMTMVCPLCHESFSHRVTEERLFSLLCLIVVFAAVVPVAPGCNVCP